jgi:hypothetical protein
MSSSHPCMGPEVVLFTESIMLAKTPVSANASVLSSAVVKLYLNILAGYYLCIYNFISFFR